jgi:hypothetical protein
MLPTHKLFFSHSWSCGGNYNKLEVLLGQIGVFVFKDLSLSSKSSTQGDPDSPEVRAAIRSTMKPCHVVLVSADSYEQCRQWVDAESAVAKNEFPPSSKPILAITAGRKEDVPRAVVDLADDVAEWDAREVVQKISALVKQWWTSIPSE